MCEWGQINIMRRWWNQGLWSERWVDWSDGALLSHCRFGIKSVVKCCIIHVVYIEPPGNCLHVKKLKVKLDHFHFRESIFCVSVCLVLFFDKCFHLCIISLWMVLPLLFLFTLFLYPPLNSIAYRRVVRVFQYEVSDDLSGRSFPFSFFSYHYFHHTLWVACLHALLKPTIWARCAQFHLY